MQLKRFRGAWIAVTILAVSSVLAGDVQPSEVTGLEYPLLGRMARITGTVVVRLTIGPDGSVTNAMSVSGHPLLAKAACENARQWKFERAKSERREERDVYLVYRFLLRGTCAGRDCRQKFSVDLPNLVTVTSEIPPIQVSEDIKK
jgi:TonB family protein